LQRSKIKFPKANEFSNPLARGQALHFFANHELLAMELMALALLIFPSAPKSFRMGIARTIAEEQKHLQMYLARMNFFSVEFGDLPVNQFFWDCLKDMKDPSDYVIRMSLTFEQANLDFSRFYRDLFYGLGDDETGDLLNTVYEEEIGHVKFGLNWMNTWRPENISEWDFFQERLSLPLSPSRSKGIIFDEEARAKSGFTPEFIQKLKIFSQSKGRPPVVRYLNVGCEESWAFGSGHTLPAMLNQVEDDLAPLMGFLSKRDDVVLVPQMPSDRYISDLQQAGFETPQFLRWSKDSASCLAALDSRRYARIQPWGHCPATEIITGEMVSKLGPLFSKAWSISLMAKIATKAERADARLAPLDLYGVECRTKDAVLFEIDRSHRRGFAAVLKAPLGASGRNMIRCRSDEPLLAQYDKWIDHSLARQGSLIVEPWLEKVCDLSALFQITASGESRLVGISRFLTTANGQYAGHMIGNIFADLPADLRRQFQPPSAADMQFKRLFQDIGTSVCRALYAEGYTGPAGIDALIYQTGEPGQPISYRLKPIVEVNPRYTMGHVAMALSRRVAPGSDGIWVHKPLRDIKANGYASFSEYADDLRLNDPLVLQKGPRQFIEGGVLFTSDPDCTKSVITYLKIFKNSQ
jgi:uncharacterized ferritin-like protein (DUF455 family)